MDYKDINKRSEDRLHVKDVELLHKTAINAKKLVEIGVLFGGGSLVLGEIAKKNNGHLYCIDPVKTKQWHKNMTDYKLGRHVTFIKGSSPWVEPIIDIDYLFIDGDHRTRWCLVDYHYWEPFVQEGGLIAFHDWNGEKGVDQWIRRAIDLILETDNLELVGKNETSDRGTIVFRKLGGKKVQA